MRAKEIPFTLYAAWTNFTRVYGMTKKRRKLTMRIKQMDGSIYDSRANENLRATVAEQAATIDYLAMMADIDIPTEDKNEMGGVDDE